MSIISYCFLYNWLLCSGRVLTEERFKEISRLEKELVEKNQ